MRKISGLEIDSFLAGDKDHLTTKKQSQIPFGIEQLQ